MSYVQQTNLLQYKNTLYRHFDNRFSVQMNRLSVWMDRQTFAVTKTYNTLDVLNKRRFFCFFNRIGCRMTFGHYFKAILNWIWNATLRNLYVFRYNIAALFYKCPWPSFAPFGQIRTLKKTLYSTIVYVLKICIIVNIDLCLPFFRWRSLWNRQLSGGQYGDQRYNVSRCTVRSTPPTPLRRHSQRPLLAGGYFTDYIYI